MKNNSLTNQKFAALANGLPVPLTITFGGTGAGTAWISGNKIIIDVTTVLQAAKSITLDTPIAFDVLNVKSIKGDGTASVTLTVLNGSDAISDTKTLTTADKTIDSIGTLDNDYQSFAEGDDDLVIAVAGGAYLGRIIIDIDK